MGVHGLWELLSPVGQRVSNEHVRNKVLAVDISIWLTQFIKAMRDAEGAQVRNAHLLGVFRRCIKLLFLSVKPVLVFDGETPLLKKRTLMGRRAARAKHEAKLRRLAEKLLVNRVKQHHVGKVIKKRRGGLLGRRRGGFMTVNEVSRADESERTERRSNRVGEEMGAESEEKQMQQTGRNGRGQEYRLTQEEKDWMYAMDVADEEEEKEKNADGDMEVEMVLPDDVGDIDEEALHEMGPNVQAEVFKQLKLKQRTRHRERMMKKKDDPAGFSKAQIEGFLQYTVLNRKISSARNALNDKTGAWKRIASDSKRQYELKERTEGGGYGRDDSKEISNSSSSSSEDEDEGGWKDDEGMDILAKLRHKRDKGRMETTRNTRKKARMEGKRGQEIEKSGVGWASRVLEGRGRLRLGGRSELGIGGDEDEESAEGEWENGRESENSEGDGEESEDVEWEDGEWEVEDKEDGGKEVGKEPETMEKKEDKTTVKKVRFAEGVGKERRLHEAEDREIERKEEEKEKFTRRSTGEKGDERNGEDGREEKAGDGGNEEDRRGGKEEETDKKEDQKINEYGSGKKGIENTTVDEQRQLGKKEKEEFDAREKLRIKESVEGDEKKKVEMKDSVKRDERESRMKERVGSDEEQENEMEEDEVEWEDGGKKDVDSREMKMEGGRSELTREHDEAQAKMTKEVEENVEIEIREVVDNRKEESRTGRGRGKEEEQRDLEMAIALSLKSEGGNMDKMKNGDDDEGEEEIRVDNDTNVEKVGEMLEEEERQLYKKKRLHESGAETVSDEMYAETRDLVKLFGIPYLQAPTEAEAQCAYLDIHGVVDGVITEDSDAFLFGAKTVYRKLFVEGQFAEAYESKEIETKLGLGRKQLIRLAYLLGSDYTSGVRGVGVVNSMEILEAFPGENGLQEFKQWMDTVTIMDKQLDENEITGTDLVAKRRRFCWKHRNMKRNWQIHHGFLNPQVELAYWNPTIDDNKNRFQWGRIDFEGLRQFCWEKFGWEQQHYWSIIGPLQAKVQKESANGIQTTIDEYFKPHRFAKIRSQRLQTAVRGMVGKETAEELMVGTDVTEKKSQAQEQEEMENEEVELLKAVERAERDMMAMKKRKRTRRQ